MRQSKLVEVDANEHGGLELGVFGIVPGLEFVQIDLVSSVAFVATQKSAKFCIALIRPLGAICEEEEEGP